MIGKVRITTRPYRLTSAERHVIEQLVEDDTRRVKASDTERYHSIHDPAGNRVGHRLQKRTIQSLEINGYIRYAEGGYQLTHAGREAFRRNELDRSRRSGPRPRKAARDSVAQEHRSDGPPQRDDATASE
jgi:hypothetical protein